MGLLGTASVGGYRAMQRGMEERGVLDNVSAFVRTAYQRAQIDRQPTAIYFWNETLREETESQTAIVVGKAVAVRRAGRISYVSGQNLFDEFADLNLSYSTDSSTSDGGEGSGDSSKNTMYLYPMGDRISENESSSSLKRSIVWQKVVGDDLNVLYLSTESGSVLKRSDLQTDGLDDDINDGGLESEEQNGRITAYAFRIEDQGGVTWKAGMAYGFEFARLELPHGYIFGSSYRSNVSQPIQEAGTMAFKVGLNRGNGTSSGMDSPSSIQVYSLRPDASGNLAAKSVGTSSDPTQDLN